MYRPPPRPQCHRLPRLAVLAALAAEVAADLLVLLKPLLPSPSRLRPVLLRLMLQRSPHSICYSIQYTLMLQQVICHPVGMDHQFRTAVRLAAVAAAVAADRLAAVAARPLLLVVPRPAASLTN